MSNVHDWKVFTKNPVWRKYRCLNLETRLETTRLVDAQKNKTKPWWFYFVLFNFQILIFIKLLKQAIWKKVLP